MLINGKEVVVTGKFPRLAKLAHEYEWIEDPMGFVAEVKSACRGADLFTFLGKLTEGGSRYPFVQDWERIAVVPLTTYDAWWEKQINGKTRNMIRKGQKAGVEIRLVEFSDELVRGIKGIYDESPLRQGKPFKHYGKDLETLKRDHISFVNRSQFITAYYNDELIGFIKLVHDEGVSHLMQIISKMSYQSKAPTNALIAKAVELAAQRKVHYLHYGLWSKRGLGDFKKHHAFECFSLRRYFIPLNWRGRLVLKLRLHQATSDRMPERLVDLFVNLREKWNTYKYSAGRA